MRKGGGDDRARTGDLLRAREALSQLSYVPILSRQSPGPDAADLDGGPSQIRTADLALIRGAL